MALYLHQEAIGSLQSPLLQPPAQPLSLTVGLTVWLASRHQERLDSECTSTKARFDGSINETSTASIVDRSTRLSYIFFTKIDALSVHNTMATTQIDMVFGLTNHPQKEQMIKEVREWLVKTDPIPGSLSAGQKPSRVEIWCVLLRETEPSTGLILLLAGRRQYKTIIVSWSNTKGARRDIGLVFLCRSLSCLLLRHPDRINECGTSS